MKRRTQSRIQPQDIHYMTYPEYFVQKRTEITALNPQTLENRQYSQNISPIHPEKGAKGENFSKHKVNEDKTKTAFAWKPAEALIQYIDDMSQSSESSLSQSTLLALIDLTRH